MKIAKYDRRFTMSDRQHTSSIREGSGVSFLFNFLDGKLDCDHVTHHDLREQDSSATPQ